MTEILNKETTSVQFTSVGKVFDGAYWTAPNGDVALWHGNVTDMLCKLPSRSVHCCISSPPYWALRDYGTAEWSGGDTTCDHIRPFQPRSERANLSASDPGRGGAYADEQAKGTSRYKDVCGKCGAVRVDRQIGGEPLHDCETYGQAQCGGCFVCSLVAVYREIHRVLRDDGCAFLNLGDSYAGSSPGRNDVSRMYGEDSQQLGLESGNLCGVPWRVALALQKDGWILRQDIIWSKPNAMPESVENRCSKSHEYVFLLVKNKDYFFDHIAILVEASEVSKERQKRGTSCNHKNINGVPGQEQHRGTVHAGREYDENRIVSQTANKKSVWSISTQGYPGAHFATFPTKLIEPMILAGTSEHGCCSGCGAPYERMISKSGGVVSEEESKRDRSLVSNRNGLPGSGSTLDAPPLTSTIGWRQTCNCNAGVEPCVVLDPFVGSGTTPATAWLLGRRGIGIDLSETYLKENAIPRIEAAMKGEKITRKTSKVILPSKAPPTGKVFGNGRKLL